MISGDEEAQETGPRRRTCRVIGRDGGNERSGGGSAEEAVPFGEDDTRARLGGAECGPETGGTATEHEDIGYAGLHCLSRWKPDGPMGEGPFKWRHACLRRAPRFVPFLSR
jgi:hypothetical protein